MVCMKKIAVLSDIHGNYIAFQKCLEYVLGMGIRAFIFFGGISLPAKNDGNSVFFERKIHLLFPARK